MLEDKIRSLITTHVDRYPETDIMDVYKLLHQGVFGPGHAIQNQKTAREWLDRESETLIPNADEILVENVHPEGQIVRLHLRPYLAHRGDIKRLLDSYIESSKAVNGSIETMATWWKVFEGMTAPGGTLASRFAHRMVLLTARTRSNEQWPANPHSPVYDRAYKPVYRVLTRSIAGDLLDRQRIAYAVS